MIIFILSLVLFLILDWIWFSLFMKSFAKEQLAGFLRFSGENIDVNMVAAGAAYLCMALSVSVFLTPQLTNGSFGRALGYSFLMGLIIFGIFDFTNLALFKGYPIKFVFADVLWGCLLYSIVGSCISLMLGL